MGKWVADFETTTKKEHSHVWAWALCEIGNDKNLYIGTDLNDFMDWCRSSPDNETVYFCNLRWDGQFLLNWLFWNEYTHVKESRDRATKTFKTMISDKGLYYGIEVVFWRKGKNIKKVTFYDSNKLLPMGVEKIAEAFRLPYKKGKIDYSAHDDLPYNSPITPEEQEYIINDVRIVAHALNEFFKLGLNKMTIGQCAMAEYKKIIGDSVFKRWFPVPTYHDDVKQCYKGGYTWVNPKFAGKVVERGVVLDENSAFAAVQLEDLLPFGTPIHYKGEYKPDPVYPVFIQMLKCSFDLKPGKIPTVQIRHGGYYQQNVYLETSGDNEPVLCLTSVDLELFFENYYVYNPEFIGGWKFKATHGMFDEYIIKWYGEKVKAKEENNGPMYEISKLFLTSLYGKFGTGNQRRSKTPYMGKDERVHFKDEDPVPQDCVYVPLAAFVTAYARARVIRAAQKITDDYNAGKSKIQVAYIDTDSLHCVSDDFSLPPGLEIDPMKLGAWKFESKFIRAKYLRQKCYIELSTSEVEKPNPEYKMKVTVAGMPKECHDQVTFENFEFGKTYEGGKKQPEAVKGGVVLVDVDFTLKP